jgi:nicotinamidase-related amidase
VSTLVVVDMQNVFAEPDSPWFTPRLPQILDPIDHLVAAYAPDVVFTRFLAPAEPSGAWRAYYQRWSFALQPPQSRAYQLIDRYAAHAQSTVDATTFGKWGAELAGRIGSGEMVLAGVATECCVLATAVAAADAGVHVRVVADACAGADDVSHEQALGVLGLLAPLVDVVDTAVILGYQTGLVTIDPA